MLAYDQRWHGDSSEKDKDKTSDPGACHVARLAVDLEGVLDAVLPPRGSGSEEDDPALQQVTCVGTSLGAAVLWSHYELFAGGKAASRSGEGVGEAAKMTTAKPLPRIHRVVYVDQAPLQNRTPDWSLGSKGCYDAETLAGLQAAVRRAAGPSEPNAFARGNAEACLSMPISAELDALLAAETNRADKEALARLMADHTQGDWRAVVRGLERQEVLVVAGEKSKIFPVEGCRWVASNAPKAKFVVFKGCGHWLYV